jgi:hypothetical protein
VRRNGVAIPCVSDGTTADGNARVGISHANARSATWHGGKDSQEMRLVAVADTHTFEADLGPVPNGDVFP